MAASDFDFNPKLIQVMGKVAEAAQRKEAEKKETKWLRCLCGKERPEEEFLELRSSQVKYRHNICPGCESLIRGMSPLVCVRCKIIDVCIPPGREKNGFEIRAGVVYHLPRCLKCSPNITSVQIVERTVFDLQQNPKSGIILT